VAAHAHAAGFNPASVQQKGRPDALLPNPHACMQGVENKKTFELDEEDINKLRDEVQKYTTESDLVSQDREGG
jgi:hypothetical protein